MSIGMSYDDFWNGDVRMTVSFRKAEELRYKRRNQELWLQGKYVYEALCDASPLFRFSTSPVKAEPYLKEPYPVTAAEVCEREEREARMMEERLKAEFAAFAERVRRKMTGESHPATEGGETDVNND